MMWLKNHIAIPIYAAAAAAKSFQSRLTLWPHRHQPTRLPIPGILQARTLEWVAIAFSNAWKWKVKVKLLSRVWLLVTLWTAAYQAPLSMGFSRQEYWSGLPLTSLPIYDKIYLTKSINFSWILKKISRPRTEGSLLNAIVYWPKFCSKHPV